MKYALSIFLLFLSIFAWSGDRALRRDTLKVEVSVDASLGTNSNLKPLWSYSQQWGRFTQYKMGEAAAYAKAQYGWTNRKGWFSVKGGVGLEASSDNSRNMVHEAFIGGRIWKIDYTFGREARTPIDQHDGLGLGTYLMSDNARPYTRAGAGFFNYWAIPGIKNWIEIKGGLYVGRMPDDGGELSTRKPLLHEKFAYLRIGHFPVKPYIGLVHSVAMGGTLADGTEVPIDFWASFFGRGSKKLEEAGFIGEYYNAAGGHHGMWDLGIEMNFEDFDASLYYQRPFYDATTMYLEDFGTSRDFHLGVDLKLKNTEFVKHLNFEYLTTVWQGGLGLCDPLFISTGPKQTGEVVGMPITKVTVQDIRDYFSPDMIREWEAQHGPLQEGHVSDFMIKYANKGRPWGSRALYLLNEMYPQGWVSNGLSMGYPTFLTGETLDAISSGNECLFRFADVRMMALNFGMAGNITPSLSYKAKFTYIDHYGNLRDQYWYDVENADFIPTDDYYFSSCRSEVHTGLWLDYKYGMFTFCGSAAWDFGQMYNSLSVRAGVKVAFDSHQFKRFVKK